MKVVLYSIAAFLVAGVFFANLFTLLPTNPNYDAAWWKCGLSAAAFIFLAHLIYEASQ